MKNLTFALACASTFALFAKIGAPTAGFESPTYKAGDKVVGEGSPTEEGGTFWFYDGVSSSEDGSTVKTYGDDNLAAPTTGDNPGTQYLELSTEGGTLWRSLAAGNTAATDIAGKLGPAHTIDSVKGLYIDTMVQFTPTEDGGAPETTGDDKLAIWLNVDSSGVTNLMVKAAQWDDNGAASSFVEKTFVLTGAGDINPAKWYRLTVKAIADCDQRMKKNQNYDTAITGFQIFLDGSKEPLKATEDTFTAGYLALAKDAGEWGWLQQGQDDDVINLMESKTLFPSLMGAETAATLQAVGFKGSGALDNLAITEAEPQPTPGPEFEVDWGASGVTAVWGATPPTADELAAIQAWATANGLSAAQIAGETGAAAYLLGMTKVPSEVPALSITSIDQTATGWTVTVACSAQPDLSKVNGKLTVKTATSLGEAWTVQTYNTSNLAFSEGKAVITVTADTARFMKAALTR